MLSCREQGYNADFIARFLGPGEYPPALLANIMTTTGCNDSGKICAILDAQKTLVLARIQFLIDHDQCAASEEEATMDFECPMEFEWPTGDGENMDGEHMEFENVEFEWFKEGGGWQCAGISHYVSDTAMADRDQ